MRTIIFTCFACIFFAASVSTATAQTKKSKVPGSCKMFLDGKVVENVSLEDALSWCELVPPTVQCDDGKVYSLNTFQVSFFTLKPLMNREFGIGEGGIPIMALKAIREGQPGDAIVLKEVTYIDGNGNIGSLPVISLKIK